MLILLWGGSCPLIINSVSASPATVLASSVLSLQLTLFATENNIVCSVPHFTLPSPCLLALNSQTVSCQATTRTRLEVSGPFPAGSYLLTVEIQTPSYSGTYAVTVNNKVLQITISPRPASCSLISASTIVAAQTTITISIGLAVPPTSPSKLLVSLPNWGPTLISPLSKAFTATLDGATVELTISVGSEKTYIQLPLSASPLTANELVLSSLLNGQSTGVAVPLEVSVLDQFTSATIYSCNSLRVPPPQTPSPTVLLISDYNSQVTLSSTPTLRFYFKSPFSTSDSIRLTFPQGVKVESLTADAVLSTNALTFTASGSTNRVFIDLRVKVTNPAAPGLYVLICQSVVSGFVADQAKVNLVTTLTSVSVQLSSISSAIKDASALAIVSFTSLTRFDSLQVTISDGSFCNPLVNQGSATLTWLDDKVANIQLPLVLEPGAHTLKLSLKNGLADAIALQIRTKLENVVVGVGSTSYTLKPVTRLMTVMHSCGFAQKCQFKISSPQGQVCFSKTITFIITPPVWLGEPQSLTSSCLPAAFSLAVGTVADIAFEWNWQGFYNSYKVGSGTGQMRALNPASITASLLGQSASSIQSKSQISVKLTHQLSLSADAVAVLSGPFSFCLTDCKQTEYTATEPVFTLTVVNPGLPGSYSIFISVRLGGIQFEKGILTIDIKPSTPRAEVTLTGSFDQESKLMVRLQQVPSLADSFVLSQNLIQVRGSQSAIRSTSGDFAVTGNLATFRAQTITAAAYSGQILLAQYMETVAYVCQAFSNCRTCNSTVCFSCLPASVTKFTLLLEGRCVDVCPPKYYVSAATCQLCPSACQTSCTQGKCPDSPPAVVCTANCATCQNSTCLACISPFILANGLCLDSCPLGLTLNNGTCTQGASANKYLSYFPVATTAMCILLLLLVFRVAFNNFVLSKLYLSLLSVLLQIALILLLIAVIKVQTPFAALALAGRVLLGLIWFCFQRSCNVLLATLFGIQILLIRFSLSSDIILTKAQRRGFWLLAGVDGLLAILILVSCLVNLSSLIKNAGLIGQYFVLIDTAAVAFLFIAVQVWSALAANTVTQKDVDELKGSEVGPGVVQEREESMLQMGEQAALSKSNIFHCADQASKSGIAQEEEEKEMELGTSIDYVTVTIEDKEEDKYCEVQAQEDESQGYCVVLPQHQQVQAQFQRYCEDSQQGLYKRQFINNQQIVQTGKVQRELFDKKGRLRPAKEVLTGIVCRSGRSSSSGSRQRKSISPSRSSEQEETRSACRSKSGTSQEAGRHAVVYPEQRTDHEHNFELRQGQELRKIDEEAEEGNRTFVLWKLSEDQKVVQKKVKRRRHKSKVKPKDKTEQIYLQRLLSQSQRASQQRIVRSVQRKRL